MGILHNFHLDIFLLYLSQKVVNFFKSGLLYKKFSDKQYIISVNWTKVWHSLVITDITAHSYIWKYINIK